MSGQIQLAKSESVGSWRIGFLFNYHSDWRCASESAQCVGGAEQATFFPPATSS